MGQFLEFSGLSKAFPGVQALDDVSFRAESGKVTALMGENGAGKSTLLKILSGDLHPDSGSISFDGEVKKFTSPHQSLKAGVSVIYQERQLINSLTVMENVFLEDIPASKIGVINRAALRRRTQELIHMFRLPIRPGDIAGRLSTANQQMVEIMKAYRRDSRIIAFDEPTAPLTDKEISILFGLINRLKEQGKIIIYVSHRMAEIFRISDEIVVLKDGRLVKTFETAGTSEQDLVRAMVGRDIGDTYSNLRRNDAVGDVVLEVNNLVTDDIHDVSFELRRGEVLGFAGLVGAGRTEVVRAIFGVDQIISGEVRLEGQPVRIKSPKDAIERGVTLCPEDRKEQGLVLGLSIRANISIPVLSKLRKSLFIDRRAEADLAEEAVRKYSIKTPTVEKLVLELSGGNQQKTILGRWTSEKMRTKILILDEPTKGIDVGTKAEVYQMVCDFARQGISVIFISSELTEVINVCDNIIVMHNGRVTGRLSRAEATEENVLELAMRE